MKESVRVLWETVSSFPHLRKVSFWNEEEKLGELQLSLQSCNVFFVQDSSFSRSLTKEEKEILWELFCQEAKAQNVLLLLSCRSAQNFFAEHPQYDFLIASKTKTKPGF